MSRAAGKARLRRAALTALLFFGCGGALNRPTAGGESHFLRQCSDDCGKELECISGVCTRACERDDACRDLAPSAVCSEASPAADTGGVCEVACEVAADCGSLGSGFECSAGFCRGSFLPGQESGGAGGGGSGQGGDESMGGAAAGQNPVQPPGGDATGGAEPSGVGGEPAVSGAPPSSGGGEGGAGVEEPCGNGFQEVGEDCDDGNRYPDDGCSPSCLLEDPFFVCSGTPSVCHRSCDQLGPANCGPDQDQDCCASTVVPGVTSPSFYRSYDGVTYVDQTYPARVSTFRLDVYEITVGRFDKFHAKYNTFRPAAGSGKNPNDPNDPGWDPAWSSLLPSSDATLRASVECNNTMQSYTKGPKTLPMNCLTWYIAQAFCIFDGGRLPTEAEWNYAAAGGTQQRVYPWGNDAPGPNANLASYDCYNYLGPGTCTVQFSAIAHVGVITGGKGLWGQVDIAGNLGEWVYDRFDAYAPDCLDCSGAPLGSQRGVRGGNYIDPANWLMSSARASQEATLATAEVGARCARNVPDP